MLWARIYSPSRIPSPDIVLLTCMKTFLPHSGNGDVQLAALEEAPCIHLCRRAEVRFQLLLRQLPADRVSRHSSERYGQEWK
ncbi:uncharacterized protein LOC122547510 isoform X4 [Chiloscyllium plagiosum]|uniref:uncharacterized protein LOC122547510 isoform X4 n=1 Tax=Chiloscyllium plagiosum TaxID=36176 RepID=UPI001CB7D904|nr:uncharacterized protein LOC122547510 isoform X4 [Chiloscyllium plagiosum]